MGASSSKNKQAVKLSANQKPKHEPQEHKNDTYFKIEQNFLPLEPIVLYNDEIGLPIEADSLYNDITEQTKTNIPSTQDELPPKCPTCYGNLSSWQYVDGVLYNFWCNACETKKLQMDFPNWTSGNVNIDRLIQESQMNIGYNMSYLEWIPFEKITNMNEIGKGGFATVYSAIWVDGPRGRWDNEKKSWDRIKEGIVAVKCLNDSADINSEFVNELKQYSHWFRDSYILNYFGISRDPTSGNFMLIIELANKGNLRSYLQSNPNISWIQKIDILESIVIGLSQLHNNAGLVHKDLHPGNILLSNFGFIDSEPIIVTAISDFGLKNPADTPTDSTASESILYGVMPYIAPEVWQDYQFTKEADIYSLAMIMWELSSGEPSFCRRTHDHNLVLDICNGVRPDIAPETPKCYVELMERCWKASKFERPTAQLVAHTLFSWTKELTSTKSGNFYHQFKQADENQTNSLTIPQEISFHPQAIYTSRSLNKYTKCNE